MSTLEGELLRDFEGAQFKRCFRWWQCAVFRKMQQLNLPLVEPRRCYTPSSFFPFWSFLEPSSKNAGVVAADDVLEGGLLRGGMLSLVGRWLLIGVLRVCATFFIPRTHGVGIGGLINF